MNPMRHCLTNFGLWRQRKDIAAILEDGDLLNPLHAYMGPQDAYVGWGNKPNGIKARRLADKHQAKCICLEDGFLRGYAPGRSEPSASYVVDHSGIYYDCSGPSDLEITIQNGISDQSFLDRAQVAISELVERRLSKYNNSQLIEIGDLGISPERPFVLLLDQVRGDASIAGAGADAGTFTQMLSDAIEQWPKHQIVVKAHPAAQAGYLVAVAKLHAQAVIVKQPCNLWPLLEGADHVYTVSSQAGFEALFCGTPVTCYGMPFYAGWGLTTDMQGTVRRSEKRSLNEVFAATYITYSHYLDLHQRHESSLENTIDDLDVIRISRAKNRYFVATCGMSLWKRYAAEPFLIGAGGKPKHFSSEVKAKAAIATAGGGDLVIWGADRSVSKTTADLRLVRMEDGFLRSVGLGAALHLPLSLVREVGEHLYFDARGPGTIESIIKSGGIGPDLLKRARKLRELLVGQRMTKYLVEQESEPFPQAEGRLKILVTGQVSGDASIRFGGVNIYSNTELIEAVRTRFPEAFIAYREHPDVLKGLRSGKADHSLADCTANHSELTAWIDWSDRLETITSLSGLEALVRGKSVGVYGWPFYAGWGLTDDYAVGNPRGSINVETLLAASYIVYPDYIHPISRMPCSIERFVVALDERKVANMNVGLAINTRNYLMLKLGQFARIIKVWRD